MTDLHTKLLRALVAAQVAVIEHADESVTEPGTAKDALLKCLAEAKRHATKLDT